MDEKAIRDTEALTFGAEDAVANGLADEIGALDTGLAAFSAEFKPQGVTMSDPTQKPAFAQADLDKARAEGKAEGAKAERDRVQGIMALDESKTRRDQAFNLAMNTELSVETAKVVLAAAPADPKPEAAAPAAPTQAQAFATAMDKGNPEVGADTAKGEGAQLSAKDQILADARAAGVIPKAK
ncbi:hypothetical protein D3C86_716540 [compost metagenome]